MQDAHTLFMNISNLVSIQINFKLFTNIYLYIHSFPMPMCYIHGGSTNLQKMWHGKLMDAIHMVQNVYLSKNGMSS
jgi:hypothetical protein